MGCRAGHEELYIAAIVSPYDDQAQSDASAVTWFHVAHEVGRIPGPDQDPLQAGCRPMALQVCSHPQCSSIMFAESSPAIDVRCTAQICSNRGLKGTLTGIARLQVELMDELQSAETLQEEMQQLAERYARMVRACCEQPTWSWLQSHASFQEPHPQHHDGSYAARPLGGGSSCLWLGAVLHAILCAQVLTGQHCRRHA